MLKSAIDARLPMVHVETDDMVHVQEILDYIVGKPVKYVSLETLKKEVATSDAVFWTTLDVGTVAMYNYLRGAKKTVIVVNAPKSPLYFYSGALIPPKEKVREYLASVTKNVDPEELMPAVGGLNMREVFEVCRLSKKMEGGVTVDNLIYCRHKFLTKAKGIHQVSLEDFGFYNPDGVLKEWCDVFLKFFKNPPAKVLCPRGLLFDGPPGTGKTMGAKYIAKRLGVPLYRIDVGAMKGKYVGTSEENLTVALDKVSQSAPCVVILDEVEKIFSNSEQGDSGVTSSMLSQLLWWLQEHKEKVFTIMTTNKASVLPKELYREGRINETLTFLGVSSKNESIKFAMDVLADLVEGHGVPPLSPSEREEFQEQVEMKIAILGGVEGGFIAIPQSKLVEIAYKTYLVIISNRGE